MSGSTVPSAHILSHLTSITTPWGMYSYYYHFTDKVTKPLGHTTS